MSILMRMIVLAPVVILPGMAHAGDAYYDVPIHELKLVEGSLPTRKENTTWRRYEDHARLEAMQPYAALDGHGEVYVVGHGEPRDTWYSPYDGPNYVPMPPAEAVPPSVGPIGSPAPFTQAARGTRVFICAPEGNDVTGRLFVPNADLTGMVVLKFTVPASAGKPEAKVTFQRAKSAHYESLFERDIPGGAWFRHQVRLARLEMGLPPGAEQGPTASARFRPGRTDDLTRTYELFTGGRAMSENLQLDRTLPPMRPNEKPVKVDSLTGITIQEIDWKALIKDAQPKLDPLAGKIPADQHVVFFPSFQALTAVADETSRHDTPVLRLAQPRSEDAGIVKRYERQLGLSMSTLSRLIGPTLVKSVALTGSDPYFPTGTDMAVVFETTQPDVLESLLGSKIILAGGGSMDAVPDVGHFDGIKYAGIRTADRRLSSYFARLDNAVVVTNSLQQLGQLADVRNGKSKSIADLPEYTFFRTRYPLGDPDETALVFLSDPTIRRWCGPRWRIADSRRTRARAVLADLQASQLDALVRKTVKPGPIHTDLPILGGGELTLTPAGVASSTFGTLDFMTPIGEIPLDEVTQAEADAYRQWRDGYQRNWSWAFDPIALRISLGKKDLAADLSVMPLILGSEYNELLSIAQGGKFEPTDGDPHDALAQFMLAVNRQSPTFRAGENFIAMMGQAVSLGWIGRWVNVYADDDPFWNDLVNLKADKPEQYGEFFEKNVNRLPVAVRIDASNPLKLAAFLTGARAFIEQTSPGLTQWESLRYQEQPYVRITPVKGRRTVPREFENIAIYYTTVDGALTITLSRQVLQHAIDRSLGRQKPQAEQKADVAAGVKGTRPWLGSSAALRVDRKILEIVKAAQRDYYESSMRMQCWSNLPILNEWKRLYPDHDPVAVHRAVWGVELVCPGGGKYVWNEKYHTMESTVYGHPGQPKQGPPAPPVLSDFATGDFGLTFENQGLRARAVLRRPPAAGE